MLRRANANRQLMKTIQQRSLQFFGHLVLRNNIHRVLIEGKINEKRGRGKPITLWVNDIVKWTGLDYRPRPYINNVASCKILHSIDLGEGRVIQPTPSG